MFKCSLKTYRSNDLRLIPFVTFSKLIRRHALAPRWLNDAKECIQSTWSKQRVCWSLAPISFPQSSSPLTSVRKTRDSGSNHFEITKEITEFYLSGFTAQSASMAHAWMVVPGALVSDRWKRGMKTLVADAGRCESCISRKLFGG